MKQYLIGIDIGTSGTKSVLFDTLGNTVSSATAEYPLSQPHNGWAEQDPEDWWKAVKKTLSRITKKTTDGEIVGLGLSGQMHSLVLLDQENRVLRPAILWCDQRTAAECTEIEARIGKERLIKITANPALTGFTASKLLWVQKHEPETFARCAHILLAKDYIRFKLTGEYATDVSDASGMQLLDVPARNWSRAVCDALNISGDLLATVYESPDITGHITRAAAEETGLPVGIPVAGGAGDNAASAIGTGVCSEGDAFTTIGTSGVVFAPISAPTIDPAGRVHTFCAAVPGTWHVMGVTQAAGLSLNWFRRQFAPDLSYAQIDALCEQIPLGAEKLLYLPYLMGERTPILDPNARGIFFGLSAMHTRVHLARAVMEGVSFSLRDCLEILLKMKIHVSRMILCGGGAKSPLWRQMLSDVYGMPVGIPSSNEGAALGAAILGGCAAGVYSSVQQGCRICVRAGDSLLPNKQNHTDYLRYYEIYRHLYPGLRDAFVHMQSLSEDDKGEGL